MPVTTASTKIDELMERASEALAGMHYFEAERMADKALRMARQKSEFSRMARILLPLQEARRQRLQLALDTGTVSIFSEPVEEEMKIESGCYVIQPPQVGADARRLRLVGSRSDVPVAVVCREPLTLLGLCPIVAIAPGVTVRTKIQPPNDPDHPDLEWFVDAMEILGDWAVDSLDPEMANLKRIDMLLLRLDAIPDHERMHQELAAACKAQPDDVEDEQINSTSHSVLDSSNDSDIKEGL